MLSGTLQISHCAPENGQQENKGKREGKRRINETERPIARMRKENKKLVRKKKP